jgi:hypothetical protein
MTERKDVLEDLGEVASFDGEVIDEDCLVLRLSLRAQFENRVLELKMSAAVVAKLGAELFRISTRLPSGT